MKIEQIATIQGGQDGVIWKDQLFRLNHKGECFVYNLKKIGSDAMREQTPIGYFVLDGADRIVPHSNAVCWGVEFFDPSDEYPLLYANVYNNYAKADDKQIGVCCVYRVMREGTKFSTALVQIIEIIMQKLTPGLYQSLGIYLPLITTNCAVLGAATINAENARSVLDSTIFGAFSGIGFALALLLFASIREKLELAAPPKSFEGTPIALVTAGILAMAFTGFAGLC